MPELLLALAFGAALVCALLSVPLRRWRDLLCLLAGLGLVTGVLFGLALGWTLEKLSAPVLAVCAASLLARELGSGNHK